MQADLCVNLVPLFKSLPLSDKEELESLVQHHHYQRQELVIDPATSNNLVIVAHGSARLYYLNSDGRENVIGLLKTGDYAGEDWLFGKENENTYVEATENSEVCLLSRQDFLNLIKARPELSVKMLEQSMLKMAGMQRQIELLSLPKVEDRLLSYLSAYAEKIGKNQFSLPLKMKDLALYLGTTPETLSRKFALLAKQGKLTRNLRQITLLEK
ncbi:MULTISPECIES: Crp/Fnr family transcriptional regulator [Lactobacillus]|uniref:Crp/Fnr family transcriptional regulator n=1 Tax=Lactobacillus xujianguonis TaxID=2495899 RepID=A0A437ST03_9LACO|nr:MULTISPECIES: Crp/Fnr family transcriptional regulator [Lactobacillus]RVU69972.1 Crp/Fnr family transcriptional regulator [Lactobacillus xujianguonis]RVU72378.1 Crp/Fnr family transcriptional regulator [Lactobacillus xujianguonis]